MQFLALAARNALRHRRRTLLTLAVVAIGVAALVLAWAVFDGQNAQMVRNMTERFSGHAQLQRPGYVDAPSFELAFDPAAGALRLRDPGLVAVAPRVSGTALLGAGAATRGVMVVGVDPPAERRVTTLHARIVEGRYLDGPGQLVLGRSLARGLGVAVGDEVTLLAEGLQAAIGAQRLTVHGVFDSGNAAVDSLQAYVALPDARALFSTGERVTALALRLRSPTDGAALARLAAQAGPEFEVPGWRRLLPSVRQSADFHDGMARLVMLVLFALVTLGMAGVLQMAVAQRLREYGMQMAIGTTPWQLWRCIVYEGLLVTAAGFAIGYALAAAAVAGPLREGIVLQGHGAAVQAMQGLADRIVPQLEARRIGWLALGVLLVALPAAALPAWRVARLAPLAALRGQWSERRALRLPAAGGSRWPALALAWRSLARAPLRSSLGLAALATGLASFVFVAAFAQGFLVQMVENTTGLVTGDLQLQHRDFRDDMRPEFAFTAAPSWLAQLRAVPQVQAASARVQGSATVSTPRRAEPVTLVGLDPLQEQRVSTLHRAVRHGTPLRGERDVLIGKTLAERLDARVGEKIVTLVQDASGQLASEAFVVAGILDTGAHGPDTGMAYVTLKSAQRLYGLGERVSSVALRLHDRREMPAARHALAALLPAGPLRTVAWDELVPEVAQTANLVRHGVALVLVIVFLMVALIVANTLLMSLHERRKEFGTLLAIGADRRSIVRMVAAEAGLLAAAGALLGLAAGTLAAWHWGMRGIALNAHGADAIGASDVVYPLLSLPLVAVPAPVLCLVVLMAAIHPAWKVARLDPIAALRGAA